MNKKDILAASLASALVDTGNSNDELAYIKRPSLSELVDYAGSLLSSLSNKFRGFTGLPRKSKAGKNKYANVGCSQDLSSQVVESIATTEEIPTKKKRVAKKSVKKVDSEI